MKSTINIFFGALFILFACTQNVSAFTGLGAGTELDPYQITTCSQLQEIDNERSAFYLLMNDIDCAETATWNENVDEWVDGIVDGTLIPDSYASTTGTDIIIQNNGYFGFEPIGYSGTSSEALFTGTLDGDGHTISNLWIFRKNETNVGIFGMTSAATIRDLGLRDSNIVGQYSVGGVVGSMNGGTANNITLQDNMVRAYLSYQGGGFAGEMLEGVVADNITNTGGVVHGSGSVIGGIVGKMVDATINNSHSSADVDGGDQIGGFVGAMDSSTINDSYATGNVRSDRLEFPIVKSGNYVGGFVGYMNGGIIDTSYATGDVEVTGNRGGGFAGSINSLATITDSYATGDVTGIQETIGETTYDAPYSVGGFAGEIYQSSVSFAYAMGDVVNVGVGTGGFSGSSGCGSEISYSYAKGIVNGEDFTGGFTGDDACEGPGSTFDQVFATGQVGGDEHVGGFAGRLNGSTIGNAYTSGTVTGNSYTGGFAGELYYTDANNVYSRSAVVSSGDEFIGAFVGKNFNDGEAIEGFWDNSVVYTFSGCGTGIEAECIGVEDKNGIEMRTQATFEDAGYDFESMWAIEPEFNNEYPFFSWDENVDETVASAPVLTITYDDILSGEVKPEDAFLEFETDSVCTIQAAPVYASLNDSVELVITNADTNESIGGDVYPGNTYRATLGGVQVGGEYSFSFNCFITEDYVSNTIESGEFTVISGETNNGHRKNGSRRSTAKVNSDNAITPNFLVLVRDITLTFIGEDVKKLQQILITKNSGPKAQALTTVGATGYFGTYTRDALVEYQLLNSISPAIGYFGSITRAQMKSAGLEGLWW